MRDISSVSIEEIIIHILDPQGQGLILSNIPVPENNNQILFEYFSNHILTSLRDRGTKPAKFRNINPEQSSGICREMLRKEVTLVSGSQKLAGNLYHIMEDDRRITAGDLAVCLFKTDKYPYTNFLGIMKIDPSQIFHHTIREDRSGNVYVVFEADQHAFTDEKLQKCAFIQPLEPRHPEYDMLLLDRQRWDMEEGRVARFFSESFLDAHESYDSRRFTEGLYRGMVNAQNAVRDQLSTEQEESLSDQMTGAITSRRVNLDSWLEGLSVPQDVRQEIDRSISTYVPEREFLIDRNYSEKLTSKVKFRGENNLKVEVPLENYRSMIVSEEYVTDEPGREPFYRIVIESDSWRRIA